MMFARPRFWFGALLFLVVGIFLEAALSRRIPSGQEGFQYFSLQFFFLNHTVTTKEIPQWMPYLAQGTVASVWYGLSTSLMQGVFFLAGPFLHEFSFDRLFLIGIGVDHWLLALGCWLWSGYYLRQPWARFLFATSLVMTTNWWSHPSQNLHSCMTLPMMFYFFHAWLQGRHGAYVFLALSFFVVHMLGQPLHQAFLSLVVLGVYILSVSWLNPPKTFLFQGNWIKHPLTLASFISGVFLLACYGASVSYGTQDIVSFRGGHIRNEGTTLNIDQFFKVSWREELSSLSKGSSFSKSEEDFPLKEATPRTLGTQSLAPLRQMVFDCGLWALPFILWGLLVLRSRAWLVLVLTLCAGVDFSLGGFTARLAYLCWPAMLHFEHFGLTGPMVKMFLCLLACVSLEAWVEGQYQRRWVVVMAAAMIFVSQVVMLLDSTGVPSFHFRRLGALHVIAGGYMVVCAVFLKAPQQWRSGLLLFLISLVLVELNVCRIQDTDSHSFKAKDFVKAFQFERMPFFPRRVSLPDLGNPRQRLLNALPVKGHRFWTNESFTMTDALNHVGPNGQGLHSFDDIVRVYDRWPGVDGLKEVTNAPDQGAFHFPLNHPGSQVWSGYTQDKVMFFDRVARCPDRATVSFFMAHGDYRGYVPFVIDQGNMGTCLEDLTADRRLKASWDLLRFDANHAWFLVSLPKPGWMSYSDVWHPGWRAEVDDVHVPVAKANLAYKMVALEQGRHVVKFDFYNSRVAKAQQVLSLAAVGWLVIVLIWTIRILKE